MVAAPGPKRPQLVPEAAVQRLEQCVCARGVDRVDALDVTLVRAAEQPAVSKVLDEDVAGEGRHFARLPSSLPSSSVERAGWR
jgi:hypothetical protein